MLRNFRIVFIGFLCILNLLNNYLYANQQEASHNNHLYTIFSSHELRNEFSGFLEQVLQQVSPEKFYALIDEIISDGKPKNDQEIYETLLQKIGTIKPRIPFYAQLKSLQNQKKVLGSQALLLLNDQKKIDNCVEIGTPGTYAKTIAKTIPFTGKLYAINDQKKWTDAFQAFSYNPKNKFAAYDHFVALNNYEPLSHTIPSNSVDLVICFIGLHHIPEDKIDAFIASIHRVLRPGGTFLLRDHDCNTQLYSMIFTAHSVYNALITGTSLNNEIAEIRNFQPLNYWIEQVEKHGFTTGSERLLQYGDPTLNTMIKFTKIATDEEKKLHEISNQLHNDKDYAIDTMQTHLTSAEWFNVDASQEYGKFIEHTPFYDFPYLTNVGIYWKIFKNSWKISQKKQGTLALLASPYTLMSLFVGVSMTIEYAAKALISWPIRTWYNGEKPLPIKVLINDPNNQIATLDERISCIKKYPETSFVLVEFPRNKDFFQIIEKMEATDIVLQEIAGNKTIQIKALQPEHQSVPSIDGCTKEYSWEVPTKPNYKFLALTIEIPKLKEVLKELKQQGIQILHIHDF